VPPPGRGSDGFRNVYEDVRYADAYADLAFPGTYHLAFRDLPGVFARHAPGRRALDFGCGAGRSTRFLERCGFEAVGVDISRDMVAKAREADPAGDYRVIADGDFGRLAPGSFDLALSAFTFDNVPTAARKVRILSGLRALLVPGGCLVNLVSSPEIYVNEWASFSTRAFPENRRARSGDVVRIVNLAIADRTPVEDVLWTDDAWGEVYAAAGLEPAETLRPLATPADPGEWVSEITIPPWVITVLRPAKGRSAA